MTRELTAPLHTNRLIRETSPYLLQHAHNPVDWMPYGAEALALAKSLGKPLFISIGYSACHWCHVMENESFTDETIAAVMNREFVCVKVDREERPDIDAVYMHSVQIMGGRGGWPLNCFAMPDGRPVWGGTYFKPDEFLGLLKRVADLFHNRLPELEEQAALLTDNLKASFIKVDGETEAVINFKAIQQALNRLSEHLDRAEGGFHGPPKFPMPVVWQMLLNYDVLIGNELFGRHVALTLERMAFGGIYDQVGGGFARYSTDNQWKVPHFEKMLYDNAQLISLYAEAYKLDGAALYREVTEATLGFIDREMTAPGGGYYSALDADSEGHEGRYYVWNKADWQTCLGEYAALMGKYYNLEKDGEWEDGFSILLRREADVSFAKRNSLSTDELKALVKAAGNSLLAFRAGRIRPATDIKIMASWNAMMVKAHADAYAAMANPEYMEKAIAGARFILENLSDKQGNIFHVYAGGKAHIPGFLEDYAFLAEALLALYQVTFDAQWLHKSLAIAENALAHFKGDHSVMLHMAAKDSHDLPANPVETTDGVIPSANAIMATTIYRLSRYFYRPDLENKALDMLAFMRAGMLENPSVYAQWLSFSLEVQAHSLLVVISGREASAWGREIITQFLPFALLAGSETKSDLPCLIDRYDADHTTIYICTPDACLLPLHDVQEAIRIMKLRPPIDNGATGINFKTGNT